MIIAIASGKGGTGKSTVAVNLALAFQSLGRRVQLIDCDVEEPNCHLLLEPDITSRTDVTVPIPAIDKQECDLCGLCARVCEFGALVRLKDDITVLPELCHSCGACFVLCPQEAIGEIERQVGALEHGAAGRIAYSGGRLNVGEPRATPVIAALKKHIDRDAVVLIDAPPGTSCPVIEALKESEFVCLVAEPTPFGLHDLKLAVEGIATRDLPFGIVVNRVGIGDERVQEYAAQREIPLLAEIPDDRRVAEAQSRGEPAYSAVPQFAAAFDALARTLEERVAACRS